MDPTSQLLYDRLQQRCPAPVLLTWMQKAPGLRVHVSQLIERLDEVQAHNAYYVKTVIKAMIDNIGIFDEEGRGGGIEVVTTDVWLSEWLYEKYVCLLGVSRPAPTTTDVIQYRISPEIKIRIEETPYLISASGTTGFRTWEAALFLSLYLTRAGPVPSGSRALELGAGTGLVAATMAQLNREKLGKLYVTDGDSQLIQQAHKNFALNSIDTGRTVFQPLRWNEDPVPDDLDYVLAADVTYDSTVVPDLCKCLLQCITARTTCLVAATVRNEDTTDTFERAARQLGLDCRVEVATDSDNETKTLLEESLLFRPLQAPVRIYRVSPRAHGRALDNVAE